MILDQFGREMPRSRFGFVPIPHRASVKPAIKGGDCHAVGFEAPNVDEWRNDEILSRRSATETTEKEGE